MASPTFVYIVANGNRKLAPGLTKSLEVDMFVMRGQAKGSARTRLRKLVWQREHRTIREAINQLAELEALRRRELAEFVTTYNPSWRDLMPELVAAGRVQPVDALQDSLGKGSTAELTDRLRRQDIDPDDPGLGGVGAVRDGWPDFPRPRAGSVAARVPSSD